jgi:hypothetical protein
MRVPCPVHHNLLHPTTITTSVLPWVMTFQNSGGAQLCVTNSPSRQSKRIQNTANDKESPPKTQGTNEVNYSVFTCLCHSLIPRNCLVKTKLTTYNSTCTTTYKRSRGGRCHGKLFNIQQKNFLGPNEYLLTLIKKNNYGKMVLKLNDGKGSSGGAQHPLKSFSGCLSSRASMQLAIRSTT